jgi:hypothetical protein
VFDEATGIWDHTVAAWSTPAMMIDFATGAARTTTSFQAASTTWPVHVTK